MIYTGIGSRETPPEILSKMQKIAEHFAEKGWTLRSGKADGADAAFQLGAQQIENGKAEIFIPWARFGTAGLFDKWDVLVKDKTVVDKAEQIASTIHPAWDKCSQGAKKLHTRNIYQVLGANLDKPSNLLICYAKPTRDGKGVQGGTATAVRLAKEYNIPVFNLFFPDDLQKLRDWVKENP